ARAEQAGKLAATATQKVGVEFSARAFETGAGTTYRVVAGPHGDAAGADGDRAKAVGAGYADAWVVPPRASMGVGQAVVAAPAAPAASPASPAVAPIAETSDADLPAVDYGIESDPLLEELLGDDLLLSDDVLLGDDYLTDFSEDQSVEEWLKAIEAEAAQSIEVTAPVPVQPRTAPATPDALPEELGEPPPEDYGAHRLRRGSAKT
ncbi:MAG: SPOR domain-containing protein, partial [Gammaproteobacteria bacterium]|nr:SPOR domain-containing protein [Gammaproteobacteria bacterium]